MEELKIDINLIVTIFSAALSSSVLTTVISSILTNRATKRQRRRDIIAKAQASVLKRVELCYRIRRRANDKDDAIRIRNAAHDIQEENEYYRCLLLSESRWYGNRYTLYLRAIKQLTGPSMKEAWMKKGDPKVVMEDDIKLDHEQICKLSDQFSLDSRRFMCFPKRLWMSIHDFIFRRVKKYDLKK